MEEVKIALLASLLAAGVSSAQTPERALVDKYCATCHNAKTKVGGLALDKLDLANVAPDSETWEKVIKKLRTGAMPPLGMPRPDKAGYNELASFIETSVDKAALAHPNPGRTALHRLNRAEYADTIRDLLALNIDANDYLPADDASYGFDNVANVLGLSPALQERYISAAAKISRLAVGDPATAPIVATYRERSDISQDKHIEGLPLGTRGGVVIHHNFPLDGEYVFKVKMLKSTVDLLFGGSAPDETLEIALNGTRLKTLTINPLSKPVAGANEKVKEGGFDPAGATKLSMSQPPDTLEVRVFVKAGPQTVTAAFLQRSYGPVEDLNEPLERSTFDPSDPRGLPHVLSVSIAGPFDAERLGRHAEPPDDFLVPSDVSRRRNSPAPGRLFRLWRGMLIANRRRTPISKHSSASIRKAAIKGRLKTASSWHCGACWPARSSSFASSAIRQPSPPTPTIASATWNWLRASRSSCGRAFRTIG